MSCGVPQGSILGPLLFIIYINDLKTYLNECQVSLYADDTALFAASSSYMDLMLSLRIDMSIISEWLKLNKLTLNVGKTKLMIFGSQRKLSMINDVQLDLNGENIERVSVFKYLGITLDQCLTFETHIQNVYNKCCSRLGMLRKARACLGEKMALTLYKSLVLPHIDLGDVVYDVATSEMTNKLQLVQNSACRVVLLCGKRDSTDKMHKDLNLLRLKDRRQMHLQHINHKNIHVKGSLSRNLIWR